MALLLKEKGQHQRIRAGVPDGADVDLTLVKLPATALMFSAAPEPGRDFDFVQPRNPRNFSKKFARKADLLGFGRIGFHDLRGIHSTALLDAGIPVHTVAQRITFSATGEKAKIFQSTEGWPSGLRHRS